MCIVLAGETQPDTTKLMNIPIKIHGESTKYNFFIYVNNFDLHKNNHNNNDFQNTYFDGLLGNNIFNGNYANYQSIYNFNNSNNFNQTNKTNSIMVVPFPVEIGTDMTKIGLVDVSTESMKKLRSRIISLKPFKATYDMTLGSRETFSMNNSAPLKVHKIGNYNISVALSLDQLLTRIDWSKFNKPNDFNKRTQTFNNTSLYPSNFDYFYVVAEAIENIKDDGFGVVYPQLNNYQYIPTAHEDTEFKPEFDVEIYNFSYKNKNKYDNSYYDDPHYDNNPDYSYILNNINGQKVKMLDETYKRMLFDDNIKSFNFKEENQQMKNHNVWFPK